MATSSGAKASRMSIGEQCQTAIRNCADQLTTTTIQTGQNNYTDLSTILPDSPPTFDAPAAKALLRLLLEVRARRAGAKDDRHNGV